MMNIRSRVRRGLILIPLGGIRVVELTETTKDRVVSSY
jgi:hypothetical protein